ncbi:BsuPI-related putative proteinase inhibitor [Mesobacillus zeae]|uniref:Intracellular proteinase inhibitor BsuPI domain-containing protein n=1 Tax=Mesobacillus zeae TaxID=1917180 RepID=A0A398B6X1_9BACI|nr:BsuPI-related putative proteinase inhibitor [Mesobacillus zeae]RID84568.1 hypothetical protein D1970_11775 [Mesobacillus zeae]
MRIIYPILCLLLAVGAPLLVNGAERGRELAGDAHFSVEPTAGPGRATFDLILKNDSNEALVFEFPTSQHYEITVSDPEGNVVYRYSEGKAFAQVIKNLMLQPGQKVTWKESWDYRYKGKRVKAGDWTVKATLKARVVGGQSQQKLEDSKSLYIPPENHVFKKILTSGSGGSYKVTGLIRNGGEFFYSVEDGHKEYLPETKIAAGKSNRHWEPFSIRVNIPEEKLPGNGVLILNLYERKGEGRVMKQIWPVTLQDFN